MPLAWRLSRPEFYTELDGEGARLFGGRWNSPGLPAVYTSSHLSLSVLETYVNIPPALRNSLPVFQAVRVSIPDDASTTRISSARFAELLTTSDPVAASRSIGDDWIARRDSLVLQVPSVLVPEEDNLLLNPEHPGMTEVSIVSTRAFQFDPRLAVKTMTPPSLE
jgi:RES domain-containing protein